jgi:hypothetical protein
MRLEALFSLSASWSLEAYQLLRLMQETYGVRSYTDPDTFELLFPQDTSLESLVSGLPHPDRKLRNKLLRDFATRAHDANVRSDLCACAECAQRLEERVTRHGRTLDTAIQQNLKDLEVEHFVD